MIPLPRRTTAPMPPPDRAALLKAALSLGVPLDAAQADRLLAYLALLHKWNRVINLTAVRDPAAMFTHHLLDCLAVVAPLRRQGAPRQFLDVGSGAGLPGLVIAAVMPDVAVTCVDAVEKKTAFIRQAAAELGLSAVTALHNRVEAIEGRFDVVASRALTSLSDFVRTTRDRLTEDGVWLAMKGRTPNGEIAALSDDIDVFHVEPVTVPGLNAARCLVWMKPAWRARECDIASASAPSPA